MNHVNYDKMNDIIKQMQKPFQDLAELNVKTLQEISYIKPEDLSKLKKPEEVFEKQISMAVENGHKALDYLKKSFEIYENAMLSLVKEAKKASDVKAK